ncbi:TolB family protein [Pedobacter sp. NJ-S-72]
MKNSLLFSLAVGLAISFNLQAQQHRLNFEQTQDHTPSLTNSLNKLYGWSDENHFIEKDDKNRQLYAVDINSGTRTAYTPPPKSDVDVMVKDNDVYIQYGKAEPKRLTNNPQEEKNPTLSPDGQYVAFTRDNDLYAVNVLTGKEIRYIPLMPQM